MPARSNCYDSSPIAVPGMTDNVLNSEALRERLSEADFRQHVG